MLFNINADGGNSHAASIAVPGRDGGAAAGILPCWGLPQLLDPQAPPRGVGVPENPPRPPWVHSADRLRSSICTLGWGSDTWHPLLCRASHCSRPHDHVLALDCTPPGGGYWYTQRVRSLYFFPPSLEQTYNYWFGVACFCNDTVEWYCNVFFWVDIHSTDNDLLVGNSKQSLSLIGSWIGLVLMSA